MFTWLKKLLGLIPDSAGLACIDEPMPETKKEEQATVPAKPKKQAKKPATKKTAKVDLDSMKKNELLAHAKANGVKANASMNKADILAAIKKG